MMLQSGSLMHCIDLRPEQRLTPQQLHDLGAPDALRVLDQVESFEFDQQFADPNFEAQIAHKKSFLGEPLFDFEGQLGNDLHLVALDHLCRHPVVLDQVVFQVGDQDDLEDVQVSVRVQRVGGVSDDDFVQSDVVSLVFDFDVIVFLHYSS